MDEMDVVDEMDKVDGMVGRGRGRGRLRYASRWWWIGIAIWIGWWPSSRAAAGEFARERRDGLQFTLRTDKSEYRRGELVRMSYHVKNVSREAIDLEFPSVHCAFEVRDEGVRIGPGSRPFSPVVTYRHLEPGQELMYSAAWDMSHENGTSWEWQDDHLAETGEYEIVSWLRPSEENWRVPLSAFVWVLPDDANTTEGVDQGVCYAAGSDKTEYHHGEMMNAWYRVENQRTDDAIRFEAGNIAPHRFVVETEDGAPVWEVLEPDPAIVQNPEIFPEYLAIGGARRYGLAWGLMHDNGTTGTMADDFPTTPGTYRVRARIDEGFGFKIVSNPAYSGVDRLELDPWTHYWVEPENTEVSFPITVLEAKAGVREEYWDLFE